MVLPLSAVRSIIERTIGQDDDLTILQNFKEILRDLLFSVRGPAELKGPHISLKGCNIFVHLNFCDAVVCLNVRCNFQCSSQAQSVSLGSAGLDRRRTLLASSVRRARLRDDETLDTNREHLCPG